MAYVLSGIKHNASTFFYGTFHFSGAGSGFVFLVATADWIRTARHWYSNGN
jgi:hypothetical protein